MRLLECRVGKLGFIDKLFIHLGVSSVDLIHLWINLTRQSGTKRQDEFVCHWLPKEFCGHSLWCNFGRVLGVLSVSWFGSSCARVRTYSGELPLKGTGQNRLSFCCFTMSEQ